MRQNGISWNTLRTENMTSLKQVDLMGDEHVGTSLDTPMRKDAFELNDDSKIELIESRFHEIMEIMGLDLNDDSLNGTPHRVAKMFVKEVFSGLNPENKPKISLFKNIYRYNEMLVEKNISLKSFCEHHFLPIVGKAHVAYISSGHVIGLSKINRIVDYYARRPQVQERLTMQIAGELRKVLKTEDVAVMIDASHMCVSMRGIEDDASSTVTSSFTGVFKRDEIQQKFFAQINA